MTGRSELSRRRRARRVGDVVYIEASGRVPADPLRHYACARPFSGGLIVGNGDHVDVLAEQLNGGVGLEAALMQIEPEPDPPINTPRIGVVIAESSAVIFSVADIKGTTERKTTELPPGPHTLALQTTYEGPVEEPVGSAPLHLLLSEEPMEQLIYDVWSSVPADLRVVLLVGTGSSVSDCRVAYQMAWEEPPFLRDLGQGSGSQSGPAGPPDVAGCLGSAPAGASHGAGVPRHPDPSRGEL